jgi:glycosyltransferase involved in cell wall biosynthesis
MEQLADEDPRIKVIKNEKNSGMLYSRSIWVLYSKGKYIIPLDSDDFFLIDDLLDIII